MIPGYDLYTGVMSTYTNRWSAADRQAFTDSKLRAQTIPGRRSSGPQASEWDYETEED